jgi:hypothetical protein
MTSHTLMTGLKDQGNEWNTTYKLLNQILLPLYWLLSLTVLNLSVRNV